MDNVHPFPHSIVTRIQETSPLILGGLVTLIYWLGLSYYNSGARKLRQFPTVGSTLPLLSLFGTITYIKNAHTLVEAGKRMWPGRIFKIPAPLGWDVIITDPTLIEDIRKAPDHLLSSKKGAEQTLQSQFTFNPELSENPFHISLVKTRLKREIPALVPDVYDELVECCKEYLPAGDDWTGIMGLEKTTTIIARAANRAFVGTTLCRNPEWIKLGIDFTVGVVKTAFILILFPSFMRPFVNYFISTEAERDRAGLQLLKPILTARRNAKKQGSKSPNDFLAWIMDDSKCGEQDDLGILERLYFLNFVAIHTTSMTATHALFDLAARPEYLKPLREEVEEVTKREGWTKAALDQMHKLDSFVKESQRLHPVGILLMRRYVLESYTFSDGTTVPPGTIVAIPTTSVQLDPDVYEDPLNFDGFRFVKMKERAALDGDLDKKYDIVTVNSEFIAFGQGKHACPARFFASAEIKLLLAHIVMTYDVKLADGDVRPLDSTLMNANRPNPEAKVYFRKRQ